ncbi:hypothetical protein [Sphingomonas xinjiangensis]|uniref:Uncharacterized protein n=1 Tax=Sphingomonas xinjiangensis TaxID=643568 RepID=A0A840YQ17_9SPHN|nr:hypothetical protein [Sphingomonas xinjiangensis]MBB5709973.1 hypothetical protein [Sphingomonas xinjiangensis]
MLASFTALLFGAIAIDIAAAKPLDVARVFLEAVRTGDVETIRRLRTDDAVAGGGPDLGPLGGSEEYLLLPKLKRCAIRGLALDPQETDRSLLREMTPSSIAAGGASTIRGGLSCPMSDGSHHVAHVLIVVVRGRVALFAFGG